MEMARFIKQRDFVAGQEYKENWNPANKRIYSRIKELAKDEGIDFGLMQKGFPELMNIKIAAPIDTFAECNKFSEVFLTIRS